MFRLTLEQGSSILVWLLVTTVGLVIAASFYLRAFKGLSRGRWWTLLALRAAAIVLVSLLLFRPVLSIDRQVTERRGVVFLVDTSASMSTSDDGSGLSRFEQTRDQVLRWSQSLDDDFDLAWVVCDDQARQLKNAQELASVSSDGQATSLTRGLLAASRSYPERLTEAIILLSDGIHNAAGNPEASAQRLGQVVHTIGVGNALRDSPSYRDVRVAAIECPDQLAINNQARITAQVEQVGLTGRVVPLELLQDGQSVAQASLELAPAQTGQDVQFQFLPTQKGRHTYTVRVAAQPDETIAQNNERSAVAQVVDSRIRVLYLEGALRAEYGALVQRFFSRDPDLEFCALVQTRPNVFLQRTNIEGLELSALPTDAETLSRFDVFLIGDLDSTYWQGDALNLLASRVREGAGLLMLGGYQGLGPGGYASTPLAAILPVELGGREIGQITEPFLPVLTPEGRAHPIFANIAGFFPSPSAPPQEEGLLPLSGCVKVVGRMPAASVLAQLPATLGQPLPVLAVQTAGKGRTAVFTADTTRNWQQAPRALDQETPFLRFWGQTIRWLADRDEPLAAEAGVVASSDRAFYEPDAPVQIEAVVRDASGEATATAQVKARLRGPENASQELDLVPDGAAQGRYAIQFVPDRTGSYTLTVTAAIDADSFDAEPVVFEVGRPNLEFDRLDLDVDRLQRIAAASGGRYAPLASAQTLIDQLNRQAARRRVSLVQPLYAPAFFWLLFVGIVTTEWVLRRRYRLR